MRPCRGLVVRGATAAAVVLLAACGSADLAEPSWTAAHSNTSLLTFDTTAPGVCAITVRYPGEAPAAIEYLGSVYVQVDKGPHAPPAAGSQLVDHSGDWQVTQRGTVGDLTLLTPAAVYDYRRESNC